MEIKNGQLIVYRVNKKYLDYIASIDKNVRQKDERKYYGIIVTNNNIDYCIPFTCKIRKRNKKLTINIKDDKDIKVIAQLTLNNMIPVHSSLVEIVDISKDRDKDYLNQEIRYLRKEDIKKSIIDKSENLLKVLNDKKHPDYQFFKGLCGDFKVLEEECEKWIEKRNRKL